MAARLLLATTGRSLLRRPLCTAAGSSSQTSPRRPTWMLLGGGGLLAGLGLFALTPTAVKSEGNGDIVLLSGTAHPALSKKIATQLGTEIAAAKVGRFADGEVSVQIKESMRGKDVFILQPTCPPVNDNLVELLLMVSAARHASARRVTAVVPYFGYKRANGGRPYSHALANDGVDRRSIEKGLPTHRTSNLAASDVANMLRAMGANLVVTVDIQPPGQGESTLGFFNCIEALVSTDVGIVRRVAKRLDLAEVAEKGNGLVVVSSHPTCLPKAQLWKNELCRALDTTDVGLAGIVRTRLRPDAADEGGALRAKMSRRPTDPKTVVLGNNYVDLFGDVRGKDVLIVEDIIDNAGTTCRARAPPPPSPQYHDCSPNCTPTLLLRLCVASKCI